MTWPGATMSVAVWPVALVSVTDTAVGCGFETTTANGDFCALRTQMFMVWQVLPGESAQLMP